LVSKYGESKVLMLDSASRASKTYTRGDYDAIILFYKNETLKLKSL
jgi:hypothetical protein